MLFQRCQQSQESFEAEEKLRFMLTRMGVIYRDNTKIAQISSGHWGLDIGSVVFLLFT